MFCTAVLLLHLKQLTHLSELQSDLLPAVDQVAPQWLGTVFATHVFTVLHHSSYSLVSPPPPPRRAGSHTVRRQTRGTRDVVAWCRRTQDTAPLPRHLPVYSDSDSHLGDRSIHTTQDTRALSVWHMDPEHTQKKNSTEVLWFFFFFLTNSIRQMFHPMLSEYQFFKLKETEKWKSYPTKCWGKFCPSLLLQWRCFRWRCNFNQRPCGRAFPCR